MSEYNERQPKFVVSQEFLKTTQTYSELPERFRLDEEIKYALLAFRKWSEAIATPTEVMAAVYLDGKNKIKVRDVNAGSGVLVKVKYADLTQLPNWQLVLVLATPPSKEKEFLLIPENFNLPYPKTPNKTVEKGKKILGFVHVHTNKQPPSPADLTNFLLAGEKEILQGIISGDNFFLFVKTKETKGVAVKNKIEKKADVLYKQTGNFGFSMIKIITEGCLAHKVGFYVGDINQNVYSRLA